jgi:hypothetical protein
MFTNTDFWENDFQVRISVADQCDLERNKFRNLTLASKENFWKYVARVQNFVESTNIRPKADRGHSSIQPTV